jgi:REP element-mobilizing transposase RayT
MKGLTGQQRKVLRAMARFDRDNGFPPTLAELGGMVGLPNINAVRGHLAALENKGYISRIPDKARSIRIIRPPSTLSRLKRRLHEVFSTDEGVLHRVVYGLAWSTYGREPRFEGPLQKALQEALEREAAEHGWELLNCRVESDHVVATVRVWPNHSPQLTVERFKAAGVAMLRRHMHRTRVPRIWAKGFAVTTDPGLLDEVVAELLDATPVANRNR